MTDFKKAERLEEVAKQATLEPLGTSDPRYVDISAGRGTAELKELWLCLEDHSARENRFAAIAFTGHRGCGKSTELLRLEHTLEPRFTPLHLYVDESLLRDCDYPDLLLWLVERLARDFADRGMPLNERLFDNVVSWFAERVEQDIAKIKAEATTELEVEGSAKASLYWVSVKVLARIKSMMQGSVERRSTIRRQLQNFSSELVDNVNLLLDDARRALEEKGREPDLLIVQDNLDRLPADVGRRLFCDNGDLLQRLRAHVIYTVPIAMILAPYDIGHVFENRFTMPMVKMGTPKGGEFKKGIDALVALVAARVDVGKVFSAPNVVRYLATMSGGSVRDLMRLLNTAQRDARVDGKDRIDMASARAAVKRLRIDFERLLIPGQAYFPLLARIHRTKRDPLGADGSPGLKVVEDARSFFSHMLFMGAVLEYNGDQNWYDVHPAVQEIKAFKDGLAQA